MTFCGSFHFLLPLCLGLASCATQTPAPAPAPAAQANPIPAAAALAPAAKIAASHSIWDGVYSIDQVGRGKKAYNSLCARCHGENMLGGEDSPALVDKDFLTGWYGKSVGSLIERTRKTMPADGPGKLSRQQCTDITAYLLSSSGFPTGQSDLTTDPDAQNLILIEAKK